MGMQQTQILLIKLLILRNSNGQTPPFETIDQFAGESLRSPSRLAAQSFKTQTGITIRSLQHCFISRCLRCRWCRCRWRRLSCCRCRWWWLWSVVCTSGQAGLHTTRRFLRTIPQCSSLARAGPDPGPSRIHSWSLLV